MPYESSAPAAAPASVTEEVARYLSTGDHDHLFGAWPGRTFMECANQGDADLRQALITVLRERTAAVVFPDALRDLDVVAFTRERVGPMVRGLFPAKEQQIVMDLLGQSVVFLTPDSIEGILLQQTWLRTAWDLAKRETFAYACEVYSRILALGSGQVERNGLLEDLRDAPMPPDERVDAAEYLDVLREAVAARNGWKKILVRCGAGGRWRPNAMARSKRRIPGD